MTFVALEPVAKHGDVVQGNGWTLHCGDYRTELASYAVVDAVITDTPYSKRTHAGHDRGVTGTKTSSSEKHIDGSVRRELSYKHWDADDIDRFVEFWHERVRGWICAMSDDVLILEWRRALELRGRLGFPAVPCVIPGMTVRLMGDGPSSWWIALNVARPRTLPFSKWGTLRGAYQYTSDRGHIGGKPLELMRAIVRDYSKRDELVCDPCAGGGTTLLAAVLENRRAVGCEIDPATFELAVARLRRGYTPTFDFG